MGGFSGFDIALAFVTMAVVMVVASAFTGRWVARHGPRLPGFLGCFFAAGGMLAVRAVLGPSVTVGELAWTVAIVGMGLGMTIVATNAAVLSIVPSERSGMASSTVNTFSELGGVFGVSILGAIMSARLTSTLSSRLEQAGVSTDFIALIITAVTHGGGRVGKGGAAEAPPGFSELVSKAIKAAHEAFGSGLSIALALTGALLFIAGIIAALPLKDLAQSNILED